MKENHKKMVAPIVVTILVVLYYLLYFLLILHFVQGIGAILLGIIPLSIGAAMIYVCMQRIKEIKGGEEDDLGKY